MMKDKEIPTLPVHMNSPMSVEALDFYQQHLLESPTVEVVYKSV